MKERIRLNEIQISGFKSYGDSQDYPVGLNDINVLIGANGAGKSNFVLFLEMVAFLASDGFNQYVARNGYANSLFHFGINTTEQIEGRLRFTVDKGTDEYHFSLAPSVSGGVYIEREFIRFTREHEKQPYQREFREAGQQSGLIKAGAEDKTVYRVLRLLRSCRIFHFNDTSSKSKMRLPGYDQDNLYLRSDAGNLAAFLYSLRNSAGKYPYYERIINIIREVLPRFEDFVIVPSKIQGSDSTVLLNWRERGSDEILGPHMLSDGTLRFIALATLLLQPKESLPGIIILDEPEIGLHPHAIRLLGEMIHIAAQNAQIIAATQSPALLEEFGYEDILVADYDYLKNSSRIRRLNMEELKGWIEEYSLGELWDKNILGGTP